LIVTYIKRQGNGLLEEMSKLGQNRRLDGAEGAMQRAADIGPTIKSLQAEGATTLRAIAAGLNAQGIPTARGGRWSAIQVMRVLARL
jgi:Recombinase